MPSGPTFVIVGASLGGARAAEALRDEDSGGQIVLVGAEPHHPYERPPLSKGYLQGAEERQSIFVHDDGWYADHAIDLRLGTAVTAIDRNLRQVVLASGETVGYDKLLLTTGAVPVRLPVPGADANGVLTLRTVDDSERLRETLASVSRVAIVGAGWIGLEVAAAARAAGVAVTVIEAAELPLLGVLGPEVAQVFLDLHREHDVDFRLSAQVAEILVSADAATGVRLADGTEISADAVVTGIGVAPATGLAEAAGLDVDGGVRTDASLRTSNPVIYAAGDAARAYHPLLARTCASSTGPTRATSRSRRPARCWARTWPTTGCRTFSATSTTSAWSTPGTCPRAATTRWCSAATWASGSSSRSGCLAGGCWPA